jgi:hypothetical protein
MTPIPHRHRDYHPRMTWHWQLMVGFILLWSLAVGGLISGIVWAISSLPFLPVFGGIQPCLCSGAQRPRFAMCGASRAGLAELVVPGPMPAAPASHDNHEARLPPRRPPPIPARAPGRAPFSNTRPLSVRSPTYPVQLKDRRSDLVPINPRFPNRPVYTLPRGIAKAF